RWAECARPGACRRPGETNSLRCSSPSLRERPDRSRGKAAAMRPPRPERPPRTRGGAASGFLRQQREQRRPRSADDEEVHAQLEEGRRAEAGCPPDSGEERPSEERADEAARDGDQDPERRHTLRRCTEAFFESARSPDEREVDQPADGDQTARESASRLVVPTLQEPRRQDQEQRQEHPARETQQERRHGGLLVSLPATRPARPRCRGQRASARIRMTVISPSVSSTRKSTRIVSTTLCPRATSTAFSMKWLESSSSNGALVARSSARAVAAPKAALTAARSARNAPADLCEG